MSGYTVTRGLGGSASSMIGQGFGAAIVQAIGGASRYLKRQLADLTEKFVISAMLISNNGKEYTKPIISTVQRVFNPEDEITIFAKSKSLSSRKSEEPRVSAKIIKVRKGDE